MTLCVDVGRLVLDVERFVEWCRKGPEMAKVSSIERTDAEPVSMPVGFYVRPTA